MRVLFIGIVSFALALPPACEAQIRGSERGAVTQVVNGTTITIDYGRPHLRGRKMFGGQIHWGEVWTPGANTATTMDFSAPARLNGEPVSAGRYSVWVIPARRGAWEVILDPDPTLYHTQPPERHDGQVVVSVKPKRLWRRRESLLFDFAMVDPAGADLEMRFERVRLPLRIDIETPPLPRLTEAAAATYVGRYGPPGEAGASEGRGRDMEIAFRDGWLTGPPSGPGTSVALIPAADHIFQHALLQDGEVIEIEQDMYYEFLVDDEGLVTGFEVRGLEDRLMWAARRIR